MQNTLFVFQRFDDAVGLAAGSGQSPFVTQHAAARGKEAGSLQHDGFGPHGDDRGIEGLEIAVVLVQPVRHAGIPSGRGVGISCMARLL